MPESKRIRIYYEGHDDRNVLEQLKDNQLLPEVCEIAKRDKGHPGREGMVQELAPFVDPVTGVGGSAIALIDLDQNSASTLSAWFQDGLRKDLSKQQSDAIVALSHSMNERALLFEVSGGSRTSRVVLVAVGLPDDEGLRKAFPIDRFAMDDYLLRLVCDEAAYQQNSDLRAVPYHVAIQKVSEFADRLRENQIEIKNAKRYLHLLRATTGFRASSAEFIRSLVGKAITSVGSERVRSLFSPLVGSGSF